MKYILFVCTHNAGRSQMAQAFWRKHAPEDVRVESAGQEPAKAPWPEVVQAMPEVGIDISQERPKKLDLEMQLHADWAITLGCGGACPYVPTRIDDWEIPDPHGKPIEEVREIRDEIEPRIKDFIATRLDTVRADHTAHQIRLQRLQLVLRAVAFQVSEGVFLFALGLIIIATHPARFWLGFALAMVPLVVGPLGRGIAGAQWHRS